MNFHGSGKLIHGTSVGKSQRRAYKSNACGYVTNVCLNEGFNMHTKIAYMVYSHVFYPAERGSYPTPPPNPEAA